jgi:hypothetical protein
MIIGLLYQKSKTLRQNTAPHYDINCARRTAVILRNTKLPVWIWIGVSVRLGCILCDEDVSHHGIIAMLSLLGAIFQPREKSKFQQRLLWDAFVRNN